MDADALDFEQLKASQLLTTEEAQTALLDAIEKKRDEALAKTGEDLEDNDEDEIELEPWYCIRTEIWVCPNPDCDIYSNFVTADHLIVVWPEKDNPSILRHAADCVKAQRNPRIVEYEERFGACISYYEWEARGCPVHGRWQ